MRYQRHQGLDPAPCSRLIGASDTDADSKQAFALPADSVSAALTPTFYPISWRPTQSMLASFRWISLPHYLPTPFTCSLPQEIGAALFICLYHTPRLAPAHLGRLVDILLPLCASTSAGATPSALSFSVSASAGTSRVGADIPASPAGAPELSAVSFAQNPFAYLVESALPPSVEATTSPESGSTGAGSSNDVDGGPAASSLDSLVAFLMGTHRLRFLHTKASAGPKVAGLKATPAPPSPVSGPTAAPGTSNRPTTPPPGSSAGGEIVGSAAGPCLVAEAPPPMGDAKQSASCPPRAPAAVPLPRAPERPTYTHALATHADSATLHALLAGLLARAAAEARWRRRRQKQRRLRQQGTEQASAATTGGEADEADKATPEEWFDPQRIVGGGVVGAAAAAAASADASEWPDGERLAVSALGIANLLDDLRSPFLSAHMLASYCFPARTRPSSRPSALASALLRKRTEQTSTCVTSAC